MSPKSQTEQLKELFERIEVLEVALERNGGVHVNGAAHEQVLPLCSLPDVPERTFPQDVSQHRADLIRYVAKKWVNGTILRYCFFDHGDFAGDEEQMDLVRQGFEVWRSVDIGIKFQEVTDISEAEIRIGFLQGDGTWSYVGRDVIDIPGQSERTMNFGWDLTADPRGVDTPVHEIGHTLGFPHEHQNPFAGIIWDEEAVYETFSRPPNNWPRERILHNILRKLSTREVEGSEWDPDSVMHYAFGPGLILEPEKYKNGLWPAGGLSARDMAQVGLFYPPLNESSYEELSPLHSHKLSLAPMEQANFVINPPGTRDYTLQTFGGADTVMVLFEDQDGDLKFVDGSDDSGTNDNSSITVRLYRGRRYVLRIRMFAKYSSDETAVMMW